MPIVNMAGPGSRLYVSGGGGGSALFADGVESGNRTHTENGIAYGGNTVNVVVSSTRAHTGTYSIKMPFGPDADGADSSAEQDLTLTTPMPDLWVSYWLYVPSNYYHRTQSDSNNNKGFLYAWSGDYAGGDGPGMGPNFLTGYGGPNADAGPGESRMKHYLFNGYGLGGGSHFDQFYEDTQWMAIEDEDKGKWVNIIIHYKYASSANNDGVATIWKIRDGVTARLYNKTDGDWYVPGATGFTQLRILGYANSGFTDLTELYVDDIQIASSNIFGVS